MPTFRITSADLLGVPERAECSDCGFQWRRPADDPQANTLPEWASMHRCEAGAPPPGWRRLSPGVYVDQAEVMHLNLPELLTANGYDDTPENRDQLLDTVLGWRELGIKVTVEE